MTGETKRWFAGVDWGSERHQVCLLDAAGAVVGERAFAHGGAGLVALGDWLVSLAGDPGAVAAGVPGAHGPGAGGLPEPGLPPHAVNPKRLRRPRRRLSGARAQTH